MSLSLRVRMIELIFFQEMEKLQAKGEAAEEELKALEMDVTGKVQCSSILSLHCFIHIIDSTGVMERCSIRSDSGSQRRLG